MATLIALPTLVNMNFLLSLDPAAALVLKDNVIHALTDHPYFKGIPLNPLAEAGASLEGSLGRTTAGDRSSIPDRNTHLGMVIRELTRITFQVQLQAFDEESQLKTSGLPLLERRARPRKIDRPPVKILTGLEVVNLDEPGDVMLNADSQDSAFGYQFQYTKLDPAVEENWVDDAPAPHRGCKKLVIKGLDSLSRISFRGRAIGDNGPGPWSKIVTISVT